jgi:hypothetical protein
MMRVSEVIRGWLGWCPNGHTMNATSRDPGYGFFTGSQVMKSPGASGSEGAGGPDSDTYEHTQKGSLIICAVSAAIILILALAYIFGPEWVALSVACILIVVLAIMSTLTVSISDGLLRIRFGPVGLIRKSWPVSEIVMVKTVTNSWYYGWGIRVTPYGPLYNVSGFKAVEVLLVSGKSFRIGTDEPDALKAAIERVTATTAPIKP